MKIFSIRGSDRAGKVGIEERFYTRLVDAVGTHGFVYGTSGIVTSETITNGVQQGAVITRTPGPWGRAASVSLTIGGTPIAATGYDYDATIGHLSVSARSTLQAKGLSAEWRLCGRMIYAAEDGL